MTSVKNDHTIILNCLRRIDDILDEELMFLNRGMLHMLDPLNIRKSHLLLEFSNLSLYYTEVPPIEIQTRLDICRRKASRNYEALGNYLHALEDLNRIILDNLRDVESDGTYSRSVATKLSVR
jgi:hypothetical protein